MENGYLLRKALRMRICGICFIHATQTFLRLLVAPSVAIKRRSRRLEVGESLRGDGSSRTVSRREDGTRRHLSSAASNLEEVSCLLEVSSDADFGLSLRRVYFVDSVAGQMMSDLQTLLGQHHGDHPRQVTERIELEDNNVFVSASWLTLSPKNPLYERLLAKSSLAEVPLARFSEPIFTMYRSDNLLTEDELDNILRTAGMTEPLNRNHHRGKGDWRQGLRNLSMGASWPGELDTIVVVNTGPHYSPVHMAPANGGQLIKSYEIVIKKVYNFLSAPPVPTLTFFRATSPAHQNCGAYSQPVLSNSSAAKNPSPEWHNYGWHMFPEFNRIAKKFFADQNSTTTRYLDIWPLSVQRPDAHTGWHKDQFDCLHVGTLVALRPLFNSIKNSGVNPPLQRGGYGIYGIQFKKKACDSVIMRDFVASSRERSVS